MHEAGPTDGETNSSRDGPFLVGASGERRDITAQRRRTLRVAALGAAVVALASASLAAVNLVLASRYRPTDNPNSGSGGVVDWLLSAHDLALVAMFLGALAAMGAGAFLGFLPRRSRWWIFGCGWVILGATVATMATAPLVRWDQLAIWSPAPPADVDGWWFAAFDADVRFVLADGARVGQGQYRLSLLAHLAGPVLALSAAAVNLRRSVGDLRQRDPRRS